MSPNLYAHAIFNRSTGRWYAGGSANPWSKDPSDAILFVRKADAEKEILGRNLGLTVEAVQRLMPGDPTEPVPGFFPADGVKRNITYRNAWGYAWRVRDVEIIDITPPLTAPQMDTLRELHRAVMDDQPRRVSFSLGDGTQVTVQGQVTGVGQPNGSDGVQFHRGWKGPAPRWFAEALTAEEPVAQAADTDGGPNIERLERLAEVGGRLEALREAGWRVAAHCDWTHGADADDTGVSWTLAHHASGRYIEEFGATDAEVLEKLTEMAHAAGKAGEGFQAVADRIAVMVEGMPDRIAKAIRASRKGGIT